MEKYRFDDLLNKEMKRADFKIAFGKEYMKLANNKESIEDSKITSYDFRVKESNDKKKRL